MWDLHVFTSQPLGWRAIVMVLVGVRVSVSHVLAFPGNFVQARSYRPVAGNLQFFKCTEPLSPELELWL